MVVVNKTGMKILETCFQSGAKRMSEIISIAAGAGIPTSGIQNNIKLLMELNILMKIGDQYALKTPLDQVEVRDELNKGEYIDNTGVLHKIQRLWDRCGINPVLVVGPAGCGKTQMVLSLAKKLEEKGMTNGILTLNGCEDTKARNLVGMLRVLPDGSFDHHAAGVAQAMLEGKLFYFDEANAVPAGTLVLLDQAMDDRRELTFPLGGDKYKVIHAKPGFGVIATVNPLSMVGTRTMPAQMMSRFLYTFYMGYPASEEEEYNIVISNTGTEDCSGDLMLCIKAIRVLRSSSADLPYRPTVRESISCHHALLSGFSPKQSIEISVTTRGYHWSPEVFASMDKITSVVCNK